MTVASIWYKLICETASFCHYCHNPLKFRPGILKMLNS